MQPSQSDQPTGPADSIPTGTIQFFTEMDRMRKAWKNFSPEGPMNKSSLSLMAMMRRLEQEGQSRVSVTELAGLINHSVSAISQKTTTLVTQGFLERVREPADRRVCYVRLTDAGRAMSAASFRCFMVRMSDALDELGPERIKTLLLLMRDLTDAINRQCQPEQSEDMEENTPC